MSSLPCKVGNLSDGALLRTASLTSWILCWQSFRARCLDGFIDIGRFNFRFSTSSSQSPFYLQAAESAFVRYCESMWGTKGSPCPFRIEKEERRHDGSITGWRSKAVRGSQQISATQAEDLRWSAAQNHCVAMCHQISRHFRWCQVIWLVPRDFNCSNSSSIGKRVQAWLAHRVPVRLSNSTSIVNEQSSCACKVGNLSDGALLRTASLTSWILCWQTFRARCLDGFIDIGRFNFRFILRAPKIEEIGVRISSIWFGPARFPPDQGR